MIQGVKKDTHLLVKKSVNNYCMIFPFSEDNLENMRIIIGRTNQHILATDGFMFQTIFRKWKF